MGLFSRKKGRDHDKKRRELVEEIMNTALSMRYAEMIVDIRNWTGESIDAETARSMPYKDLRKKWESALLAMIESECEKKRRKDIAGMERKGVRKVIRGTKHIEQEETK